MRVPWLCLAAGTVLNTAANLVYTPHDQNLTLSPAPRHNLYIPSYVAIIVGIAVLTQGRLGVVHLSVRLDGIIMALALGSLAGALWFEPLLQVSGRPAAAIVMCTQVDVSRGSCRRSSSDGYLARVRSGASTRGSGLLLTR